jgi:hypothetical protein
MRSLFTQCAARAFLLAAVLTLACASAFAQGQSGRVESTAQERTFRGGLTGADMRGQSVDGTYWRFIGRFGESVQYSGLTEEQAALFDGIIQRACMKQ